MIFRNRCRRPRRMLLSANLLGFQKGTVPGMKKIVLTYLLTSGVGTIRAREVSTYLGLTEKIWLTKKEIRFFFLWSFWHICKLNRALPKGFSSKWSRSRDISL